MTTLPIGSLSSWRAVVGKTRYPFAKALNSMHAQTIVPHRLSQMHTRSHVHSMPDADTPSALLDGHRRQT